MVQCSECKEKGVEPEYTHPYESGLQSKSGGFPVLTGFILPNITTCNTCGDKVQVAGWFEKNPYI